jgi:hypothetical protein
MDNRMLASGENTNAPGGPPGGPFSGAPFSHELFPGGFEVMGQWTDPETGRSKTWARFFCTDSQGRQVGRDAFSRVFDSATFVAFMCSREIRSTVALEPQGELSHEDQKRIAEILGGGIPPDSHSDELLQSEPKKPSFLQRIRKHLAVAIRKLLQEEEGSQ